MIRFEAEQTIDRSADDVWAYAAGIVRHPEWMGVIDARVVHGTGTEVGTRAIERLRMGPRIVEVEITVSESIPARRIAWKLAGGGSPMAGDVMLDLEPLGSGRTRATWSGSIGLTGIWRLIEPLMAGEIRDAETAELRRLKVNLEATPPSAAMPSPPAVT